MLNHIVHHSVPRYAIVQYGMITMNIKDQLKFHLHLEALSCWRADNYSWVAFLYSFMHLLPLLCWTIWYINVLGEAHALDGHEA